MCTVLLTGAAAAQDFSQYRQNYTFSATSVTGLSFDHATCRLWIADGSDTIRIVTPQGDTLTDMASPVGKVREISVGVETIAVLGADARVTLIDRGGEVVRELGQLAAHRDVSGIFWDDRRDQLWISDRNARAVFVVEDWRATKVVQLDFVPEGMDRDLVTETTYVVGGNATLSFTARGPGDDGPWRHVPFNANTKTDRGSITTATSAGRRHSTETYRPATASQVLFDNWSNGVTDIALKMIDNTFVATFRANDGGNVVEVERRETFEHKVKRDDVPAHHVCAIS